MWFDAIFMHILESFRLVSCSFIVIVLNNKKIFELNLSIEKNEQDQSMLNFENLNICEPCKSYSCKASEEGLD